MTLHISWVSFCLQYQIFSVASLKEKKDLDTSLGILLSVIVGANYIIREWVDSLCRDGARHAIYAILN